MPAAVVRWASIDVPEEAAALLTEAERSRLHAFADPDDRRRYLAAHVLVRLVVAEVVGTDAALVEVQQGCERCGGPHGRPVAVVAGRRSPEVSFSHAGEVVVAAACASPVGVDVEPRHQPAAALAAIAEQLPATPADDLLQRWVAAEAAAKAAGTGFTVAPGEVGFDGVRLTDLDLADGYVGVVAVLDRRRVSVDVGRIEWSVLRATGAGEGPTTTGRTGR